MVRPRRVKVEKFLEMVQEQAGRVEVVPEGVRLTQNVPYSSLGSRRLVLDMYNRLTLPSQRRPAFDIVHGGGWGGMRQGCRSWRRGLPGAQVRSRLLQHRLSSERRGPVSCPERGCPVRHRVCPVEGGGVVEFLERHFAMDCVSR